MRPGREEHSKPMMVVRVKVQASEIHGLGCFAAEPIAAGQLVWTFDPRIDSRVPVEEIPNLPQPAREFLAMYGFEEVVDGRTYVTLCGDHGKHMNHSDTPNCLETPEGDNIAGRDIPAGEELTCDYYLFDGKAAERIFNPAGGA